MNGRSLILFALDIPRVPSEVRGREPKLGEEYSNRQCRQVVTRRFSNGVHKKSQVPTNTVAAPNHPETRACKLAAEVLLPLAPFPLDALPST